MGATLAFPGIFDKLQLILLQFKGRRIPSHPLLRDQIFDQAITLTFKLTSNTSWTIDALDNWPKRRNFVRLENNIVGWSFKKQQHKNKLGPVYLFLLLSFENLGMKVFLLILALFIFFRSQTAKWITLSGHPRRLRLTSVGLIHSFPSNFSLPFSIILLPFHSLDIVIIYVD